MKFAKLTAKLAEFFSSDRRRQRDKRNKLKTLLKEMKKQQKDLEHALEKEDDAELRAGLALKLQILVEQRRKGVHLRQELEGKRTDGDD